VFSGSAPGETSQSRLLHEGADDAERRGQQLLKDSLLISDGQKYERVSREAVSLSVEAARLRSHAKKLEKALAPPTSHG
jgi:hypothetical protein